MDKPWKVIFAFVSVFVAGAIFGGLLALRVDRTVSERRLQEQAAAQAAALAAKPTGQSTPTQAQAKAPAVPAPQAAQSAQLMRRVTNQLNLTAVQRTQINPIIQRAVQDFWRERQNFDRENVFLTQRLKQDIAKNLNAQQQARLDELWEKQIEILRKRQAEAQAQARAQAQQKATDASGTVPAAKPATDDAAKKTEPLAPAKSPGTN